MLTAHAEIESVAVAYVNAALAKALAESDQHADEALAQIDIKSASPSTSLAPTVVDTEKQPPSADVDALSTLAATELVDTVMAAAVTEADAEADDDDTADAAATPMDDLSFAALLRAQALLSRPVESEDDEPYVSPATCD
eukprot:7385586-Prymnesium_polylepis.1